MFSKRTTRRPFWPEQPYHRAIVAVDTADSTARTDTAKACLRRTLYEVFEDALHTAGIEDDFRNPLIDRGDGILAVMHPIVPKTVLLNIFIAVLGEQLTKHHDLGTGPSPIPGCNASGDHAHYASSPPNVYPT